MGEKTKYSRRDFLKIVGASTGVAATGCAPDLPEKLIPYVVQPDEVVPGVASWYASSCRECSAGCGLLVRTREGRVVKVEGNPAHPINKGGLCAVGQSSVQGLYDPDRVREPLKREINGAFKPVAWKEAIDTLADAIQASSKSKKEVVFVTNQLTGSESSLISEFLEKVPGVSHVEFSLLDSNAQTRAAEKTFGAGARIGYDFSRADVILGVGADYLGTWDSPVEYTKGFSKGRRPTREGGAISRVYHIEPRLSLTAANADQWVMNTPGSESRILLAILKTVLDIHKHEHVSASIIDKAEALTKGIDTEALLKGTDVSVSTVKQIAKDLIESEHSLIVAGGESVSGSEESCAIISHMLNLVLGNVGSTFIVHHGKSVEKKESLGDLISGLAAKKRQVGVLVFHGVNPAFVLPRDVKFQEAATQAGMIVCLGTHLDETSKLAQLIIPMSNNLESWNDAEPIPGVYNLSQPAMQSLYKTQGFGDTLLSILASSKINQPLTSANFHEYIREQWKKKMGDENFESRWLKFVELGGAFDREDNRSSATTISIDNESIETCRKQVIAKASETLGELSLLAFASVRFGDGSAANRPWMQEIPDPITSAIWGSWVEMHPRTAKKHGVSQGQVVQVRTKNAAVDAPAYITERISENLMAMPVGQGHDGFGRYASGVGANPLHALTTGGDDVIFLVGGAFLAPTVGHDELLLTGGSDTQLNRELIRSVDYRELKKSNEHDAHNHDEHNGGGHHGGHELGPQPSPKQMYRQQPHVLYRWGMSVDVSACTGCSACVFACYAENNIPVVGKELASQGREMAWVRIERYFDGPEHRPVNGFQPMMCQHCNNAPCEPVCPVYATYHSDQGLNTMVYNRCVGTRYCSNNCSYKVRRFNWFQYTWPEPLNWQLNPDITVRGVGVMEKCSFCIQRIREVENNAKDQGRPIKDGEVQPACASSCPADAITFGNLVDSKSKVSEHSRSNRSYKVLDAELNTQPAITYLAKVTNTESKSHKEDGHA